MSDFITIIAGSALTIGTMLSAGIVTQFIVRKQAV